MATSLEFCDWIKAQGFDFFTGVPDSTFQGVLRILEEDPGVEYLPAVREDIAIGLAVGAYLGGRRPMVLMQNSGLGTSVNALTSLALLYKTPMLLLIGWRGYNPSDAPEHSWSGMRMEVLLRDLGMPYEVMEASTFRDDVRRAVDAMQALSVPAAVILRDGVFQ